MGDYIIGDFVEKLAGDYEFRGHVVAKFTKHRSDVTRYVVENSDGILHIFSGGNLALIASAHSEASRRG